MRHVLSLALRARKTDPVHFIALEEMCYGIKELLVRQMQIDQILSPALSTFIDLNQPCFYAPPSLYM